MEERYIDVDKLIWQVQDSDKYGTITKQVFISLLQNSETADVAPVIHAHWELYEDGWYCTNCELYAPFDCDPEEKGVPYCPNCGAKMDGGEL